MSRYTLEQAIEAMKELISLGFWEESDFYPADEYDVDVGFMRGEPMLKHGDDCNSAFDLLKAYKYPIDYDADYWSEII